jgi:hypothetical protein
VNQRSNDDPLDFLPGGPEDKNEEQPYKQLRLLVSGVLIVGFVFRVQHWPYGAQILVLGLLGWVAWNILLLARFKTLRYSERFYTFGRLAMAGAVTIGLFQGSLLTFIAFGVAALLFIAGMLASEFRSTDNAGEE